MFVITILAAALSVLFLVILFYKLGHTKGITKPQRHQIIETSGDVASIAIPDPSLREFPEQNGPKGLDHLQQKFPNFVLSEFLSQADGLFDTIFAAFVDADRNALKAMLTTTLYRGFSEQIRRREEKDLRQEIVIKHNKTTLDRVQILMTKAKLLISFNVSQMNAIINSDGALMDNPNKIFRDVLHNWTFERKYGATSWILAKTSSIEI
ncbi:MAG: Tim44/TimA family putative adaptor protein [Holosporales bacterium]|jgi:predicted lipid-binding transport protein (Tim44 family)|nr:Tim44/TimA family putative adaptor protein [Holosporales bacterium]